MTRSQRIGTLMFRYVRNELDRSGKKELNDWRNESQENEQMFQRKTDSENILRDVAVYLETKELAFQKLKVSFPQIWAKPVVKIRSRVYRLARIAAIFIVLLGVGVYFILHNKQNTGGSYQADLIDAEGAHNAMNDFQRGFRAGSAGIRIEDRGNGELVYIAKNYSKARKDKYWKLITPRSGAFDLKLPDGTMIWLNAQSSIEYPANFSQDSIKIKLAGEAYFELAKDMKHVFIISLPATNIRLHQGSGGQVGQRLTANGLQITSTYAHFNVKSYADEPLVSATLIEGTAQVQLDSVNSALKLSAGQQAELTDQKPALVAAADTSQIIAWKNGEFYYKDAALQIMMPAIAKWYDVNIQYAGQIPDNKFSLRVPRNTPLSKVLENLQKQGLHITQQGKTVTVWK
jgi:transmembrane sensor